MADFAERLGARLVDLTVSGATTANILDTPQQMVTGPVFPPQIDGVPGNADVVTITAGGNDLQFAGAMLYAASLRLEPQSPMTSMLAPGFPDGIPVRAEDAVEGAATGLARVVEKTRAKAPAARVLLVDYLTVLDPEAGAATPFSDKELGRLPGYPELRPPGLRRRGQPDGGSADPRLVTQRRSRARIRRPVGAALPPGHGQPGVPLREAHDADRGLVPPERAPA